MSISKTMVAAAVLSLAALTPSLAEPVVVITLSNVADRVRTQNPDLAAARFRIKEALGRMRQAGRRDNPTLETGVQHDSRLREGSLEIGISQRFPLTDRLQLEKDISLTELKAAEAEVRDIERQLTGRARETVVKILSARQRSELLERQARISRDFAGFLAEIVARGEGSALDLGQAKLESSSLDLEIRQRDVSEIALFGELRPLLGMRPGEPLHVSGKLPEISTPKSLRKTNPRPDLVVATLEAQAAEQGVSLQRARRYDDVEGTIFAGAERSEDAPEGYQNEAIAGFRLKIALPFWNNNDGAISEAVALQQRKAKEVHALARGIQLEAEAARNEMAAWAEIVREIDETLLPMADEQTTVTHEAYRNGQVEIQIVLRSRDKQLQLAGARLDAMREYHLARVRLETALAAP